MNNGKIFFILLCYQTDNANAALSPRVESFKKDRLPWIHITQICSRMVTDTDLRAGKGQGGLTVIIPVFPLSLAAILIRF